MTPHSLGPSATLSLAHDWGKGAPSFLPLSQKNGDKLYVFSRFEYHRDLYICFRYLRKSPVLAVGTTDILNNLIYLFTSYFEDLPSFIEYWISGNTYLVADSVYTGMNLFLS
jgi:hypothetical protein